MTTILIIAAIWLGAIALTLLWVHGATRKPDPEWPEFDVLGEAQRQNRDGWLP
jgi:nitrogen fixation-related uncharacterized protein